MFVSALILSAVLQASSPTASRPQTAADVAPVNVEGQRERRDDPSRLVCQSEPVVGTNRRRRICMTVAERDERRAASRAESGRLDRAVSPGAAGNGQGGASMPGRGF